MNTLTTPWHSFSLKKIYQELETSENGLSIEEARNRLKRYGENSLPKEKTPTVLQIFLNQFRNPLIYILLAASFTIYITGETTDSLIILAVLFFNAIVGTIQEGKAQNTLSALKKFVETSATVLRDGERYGISDQEVVPGDIIILQEGEKAPADARIIMSHGLRVDEASLTGESEPVNKIADIISRENLPLADQKNIVFKGTYVSSGNGKAVVVATNISTAIGKIAKEISVIDTEIPLKTKIRHLSKAIIVVVFFIAIVIFAAGVVLGHPLTEMLKIVVSLSVSIIPEGLPVVMTLVLATGVWRMSKHNALVKRLQAVEALGQAQVIALDKTGTITKNELVIRKVFVENKLFDIDGIGYEPKGGIMLGGNVIDPTTHDGLSFIGKAAALCANAGLYYAAKDKQWRISGDPTEAAMLVFGEKIGFHHEKIELESPLIAEVPFDYKLKYHATLHQVGKNNLLTVIGAPEVILNLCQRVKGEKTDQKLTDKEKQELQKISEKMSGQGLRVLAVAVNQDFSDDLEPKNLNSLSFVGLLGMQDALRPEVKEAVSRAKETGIRVVMVTGDHKITAQAIAKEAGIYRDGDEILTGADIDSMSDVELSGRLSIVSVFARVTPEHKLKIINAYKKRGEIIAMTGDGVNDAPSLVAADLGVAMGKIGTEVAKEASDIVLLDDNFGSIVSAIEEGRSIYKTIKRVMLYLFSTSLGEILTITGALLLGYPLPILAAQIIWLNFVTDGFLDVALAMEPKAKSLLWKKFERPSKYLVDSLMLQRMFIMAIPMAVGTLFLFKNYIGGEMDKALTISLVTLAFFQWYNAWNCRSESKSIFRINPFSNKFLVAATVLVFFLQILAVYHPTFQKILHTVPIEASEWIKIAIATSTIVVIEEVRKFLLRRQLMKQTG